MFLKQFKIKNDKEFNKFLQVYYGKPFELDKNFKSQYVTKDSNFFKEIVNLLNK